MTAAARKLDPSRDHVIAKVSELVHKITGVQLGQKQEAMVENRMLKRIMELRLETFADYLAYLEKNQTTEIEPLVGLLTTHHSYFFREYFHFEYLESIMPQLVEIARARPNKTLRIWSSACSRGQEAYSLSMFLLQALKATPDVKFEILGTDVDIQSVRFAQNGVYERTEMKSIPMVYQNYFAKGTGNIANFVKVKNEAKNPCKFAGANLFAPQETKAFGTFDLIFCRNVMIYFTAEQVKTVVDHLLQHMEPTGLLFIGISESLMGLKNELQTAGPSIYRKPQPKVAVAPAAGATASAAPKAAPVAPQAAPAKPVRVVCVDDSGSIITLLKKMLTPATGFEVVGVAKNGIEAQKLVKELKPDAITLDLHMPEMGGIEYLEKNMSPSHPPVVVISSVAREEAGLALRALELGASDYVEKPAMNNLQEKSEEISAKLKCVARYAQSNRAPIELDKSFSKTEDIKKPEAKLVLGLIGAMARGKDLRHLMSEVRKGFPAVVVLVEGVGAAEAAMAKKLSLDLGREVKVLEAGPLKTDTVYLADFARAKQQIAEMKDQTSRAIWAFQGLGPNLQKWVGSLRGDNSIFVEDAGDKTTIRAHDTVPATSFPYLTYKFFADKEAAKK